MSGSTERKKFNRFTFHLPLIVKPHVHRLSFSKWRKSNILAKVIQLRALHSSHAPPGTKCALKPKFTSIQQRHNGMWQDVCRQPPSNVSHRTHSLKRSLITDLAHWLRMRLPLSCRTTSLSNKYPRHTSTFSSLIFPIMTRDDHHHLSSEKSVRKAKVEYRRPWNTSMEGATILLLHI